jgi:DNA (cytosine-5)-methyltransferase 1
MSTRKPLLLDLYCGAGGAGMGYMQAGFNVVGVDIRQQTNYPGSQFIQMSALDVDYEFLDQFDVIHASPPCQLYSKASAIARKRGIEYPDLVHPTRALLISSGKPYVMENVVESPVYKNICLDGSMFDLGVIRRRAFETNVPGIPVNPRPSTISGRVIDGDYVTVAGGGKGIRIKDAWSKAMGIDWMTKDELRESIPPAYTRWIGEQLLSRLAPGMELSGIPASNPRASYVEKVYPVQLSLWEAV